MHQVYKLEHADIKFNATSGDVFPNVGTRP